MKLHENYIKALEDQFKDQEYKGSEWEKADESLFYHYTKTQYKVSSLPDEAKWVTEEVDWGSASGDWDDFDPAKVKIWESDEIGKKFKGIITCYEIDFDFRDESEISNIEKEMIDKIKNNPNYVIENHDEWVDFEMNLGSDMIERDHKFLDMKLGDAPESLRSIRLPAPNGDETNSFFPVLKFLDKDANKKDNSRVVDSRRYSYSYINDKTLPLLGHWTGMIGDYATSTNCKDVLFLHPISGEWEKVSFTYYYNDADDGIRYDMPANVFDHIDRIKKYGKK